MECGECKFWEGNQTGRPNAKGSCCRFPDAVTKRSGDWCGEWQKGRSGLTERHNLMKECKEWGVPFKMKWDNDRMKKEIEDAKQKAKTEDPASEGQAGEEAG